jgi:predicted tellurium resistance membrane protein TerC
MEWLSEPGAWIALITLTLLEIVLGIDNVIFISILSSKLPAEQQPRARQMGLALALVTRILLLLSLGWVMTLTGNLFRLDPLVAPLGITMEPRAAESAAGHGGGPGAAHPVDPLGISGRDLILILGGLFLIWKSVKEIHHKLEGYDEVHGTAPAAPSFNGVIVQILILDVVFSLDSVITAVGMANRIEIMIAAVVIAVGFMLAFAGKISGFVDRHPTVKMLALAFLVLIGVNLLGEGFDQRIEKGYTYFAMAFAVAVEMLNLRMKGNTAPEPVHLRH